MSMLQVFPWFLTMTGLARTYPSQIFQMCIKHHTYLWWIHNTLDNTPLQTLCQSYLNQNLLNVAGFSRIPVYEGSRKNIITVLYIKDLALVDPDDNTPLKTLCQFYQNPCYFVFEDTTLDVLFKQFKEGLILVICFYSWNFYC